MVDVSDHSAVEVDSEEVGRGRRVREEVVEVFQSVLLSCPPPPPPLAKAEVCAPLVQPKARL